MPATHPELLEQPALVRLALNAVALTAAARHRALGALLHPRAPHRLAVVLSYALLPFLCLALATVLVGLAYVPRGLCVVILAVSPYLDSAARLVNDVAAAL